jgi:hypothetical protein
VFNTGRPLLIGSHLLKLGFVLPFNDLKLTDQQKEPPATQKTKK